MSHARQSYKILIVDLIGLKFDASGQPDASEVKAHIATKDGVFHVGLWDGAELLDGRLHFFYAPHLSTAEEILPLTDKGQYDGVIAAATFIPAQSVFAFGGVRIGAGTGNMGSISWGGGSGIGGAAPLMNTPGFNSLATAQMVFKALLRFAPDLDFDALHARVVAGDFDTGRNLRDYPTAKLEGRRFAIIGYGNIGKAVARLAQAFGMDVVVYARAHHRAMILQDGFTYAASVGEAAQGANVISVHVGLGALDAATGRYANAGLMNDKVLAALNPGAILINFDRGEVVDAQHLAQAMRRGQVAAAAIDADIFRDETTGKLSGPMVPYLPLANEFAGRILLLPHVAADTDHPSRVAGAKQAVDQIFDCILNHRVTNLKGDLPAGYVNAGAKNGSGAR
jgi:lactate dehydrogenase-like 2-hydroxyacid dehydrogenase